MVCCNTLYLHISSLVEFYLLYDWNCYAWLNFCPLMFTLWLCVILHPLDKYYFFALWLYSIVCSLGYGLFCSQVYLNFAICVVGTMLRYLLCYYFQGQVNPLRFCEVHLLLSFHHVHTVCRSQYICSSLSYCRGGNVEISNMYQGFLDFLKLVLKYSDDSIFCSYLNFATRTLIYIWYL